MATYRVLPTELKMMIIEYSVIYGHPINDARHKRHFVTVLKLASLDRRLYTAIQEVYYTKNEFLLEPDRRLYDKRCPFLFPALKYPPPALARRWIRRLRVDCSVQTVSIWIPGSENPSGIDVSELTYLAGRRARWQRYFAPSELHINLNLGEMNYICYGSYEMTSCEHLNGVLAWRSLGAFLENASVHMKAPSVTVNLIGLYQMTFPPCVPCAGVFARMVGDWFRKGDVAEENVTVHD
jgi:hypothetical protein